MDMARSPEVCSILSKILGPDYATSDVLSESHPVEGIYLQPEQMSTFIAKSTGQILSYEHIQWLWQKTEGWLPALYWIVEILQEDQEKLPWNRQHLSQTLQERSFSYFNQWFQERIPPQYHQSFLTLALLPTEINSQLFPVLFDNKSCAFLTQWLKKIPWLTQTSPTTWRFHPLFKDYLLRTIQEQLPQYKQICLQLMQIYLDQDNPLAVEELLAQLPPEEDSHLASLLFSLGESLVRNGHKEKALTYFGRASLGFGQLNDSLGITRSLNAMGALYLELGKISEAEILYQQIKQEISPHQWNDTFISLFLSRTLPKLKIHCLGEFRLYRRDEALDCKKWRRRKALSILYYLILQPSHRATKEELLDLFWPEEPPEKASNAYHVTIHALRQALSAGLTEEINYLGVERGAVYLISDLIGYIDVEEFHNLCQEGHRLWSVDPTAGAQWFQRAKKLYQGQLLEDVRYEEWLFPFRESLNNQYLGILSRLALHYTHQKEGSTALGLWKEILRHDPVNEYAVRETMILLHRFHRRNEALTLYKKFVRLLQKELNATPEPQTITLYQDILKNVRWDDE